ncbi:DEAD/DEAH box helicase family protein [Gammaproteobacteria bacterium]|nr:DEAD/DEAH box helicase family protein [Gammaproteobacteria bacterium]
MGIKRLRPWQAQCVDKAIHWLTSIKPELGKNLAKRFLINAAPGAGKTIAASVIAEKLISLGLVERVIVLAPLSEVVTQWGNEFKMVTSRYMGKVTSSDGDLSAMGIDICASWAAVQNMADVFQAVCQNSKTLVICDEIHHAAVEATWGSSAGSAFADAEYVLLLTGTPIRSDGEKSVWMAYDTKGAINHPAEGSYTISYGECVDLGYCRPASFHRHEGKFSIEVAPGRSIDVSGYKSAALSNAEKRIPGLQTSLKFYNLAKTPQFENDGITPLKDCFQWTMLEAAVEKLNDLRLRMPNAGALAIAPNIETANFVADILEIIEGERPIEVNSNQPNAANKINAFRNTDKRWIVSVGMVSEGVDIKRLRVLTYLPNALTELAFRQAVGRVVRTAGPEDDTRAYVIMPSFETFDTYARRVEKEMPLAHQKDPGKPRKKTCPTCGEKCELGAHQCHSCGHEFPTAPTHYKPCTKCSALNPLSAKKCQVCGEEFGTSFTLSLDQALRAGAIARGMDLSENEVKAAEKIAPHIRSNCLKSGDENLVRIVRILPEETWSRLSEIVSNAPR